MDKIIVGLKRVIDYNVRVQVKSDGSGVETDGVKMSINPFDEIALEEALQMAKHSGGNNVYRHDGIRIESVVEPAEPEMASL